MFDQHCQYSSSQQCLHGTVYPKSNGPVPEFCVPVGEILVSDLPRAVKHQDTGRGLVVVGPEQEVIQYIYVGHRQRPGGSRT